MLRKSLCSTCLHYIGGKKRICKAFPNGIPYEILAENVLHYNKIDSQKNDIVYEPKAEDSEFYKSILSEFEALSINRSQLESEIIRLLWKVVKEQNINHSNIKLIAYWLQCKNRSHFFWNKHFKKTTIFVVLENNEIIELEVGMNSDFVEKAYDLLWVENFKNQNSSMHILLNQDSTYQIAFTIEHIHSVKSSFIKHHTFLRTKEDYENIEKSDLYKNHKIITQTEKIEIIKAIWKAKKSTYLNPYVIFLHFYIKGIVITPTEAAIILREIKLNQTTK